MLRALVILSALGFLTLVMVQAMAFYAPPPESRNTQAPTYMLAPPTKDAPVALPPPLVKPALPREQLDLFPATKAGTLRPPRWLLPTVPAQQQARELVRRNSWFP